MTVQPKLRFNALGLVHGVVAGIANDLRGRSDSHAAHPGHAGQLAAFDRLSEALASAAAAGLRKPHDPEFSAAFAPYAVLFEEANAATRDGGLAVSDIMASSTPIPLVPFPVTPAGIAWLGIGCFIDCLRLIARSPTRSTERRASQLAATLELQAALAELITDPGRAQLDRVNGAFASAAAKIAGGELATIRAEAFECAAALAPDTQH